MDWVGTSVYHYGTAWPWTKNALPVPGQFQDFMNHDSFYDVYAVGHNKPCMIAESGVAYHLEDTSSAVSELAMKQAWWRQYITNATFLRTHPQIKMISLFEFQKVEENDLRDFRITNDSAILNAFKQDLAQVKDFYEFASYVEPPRPSPSSTPIIGSVNPTTVGSSQNSASSIFGVRIFFGLIAFLL